MCGPGLQVDAGSEPIRSRPFVLFGPGEVIRKQCRPLVSGVRKQPLDHVGNPAVILVRVESHRMSEGFANQLMTKPVSRAELGQDRLDDFGVDQPGKARDDLVFTRVRGCWQSRPVSEARAARGPAARRSARCADRFRVCRRSARRSAGDSPGWQWTCVPAGLFCRGASLPATTDRTTSSIYSGFPPVLSRMARAVVSSGDDPDRAAINCLDSSGDSASSSILTTLPAESSSSDHGNLDIGLLVDRTHRGDDDQPRDRAMRLEAPAELLRRVVSPLNVLDP